MPPYFNPLSLYRERRRASARLAVVQSFQSTLPIQGETKAPGWYSRRLWNFNPLSLYRERLNTSDTFVITGIFQSTLPIQGETKYQFICIYDTDISIHSPYTGRDSNFAHKPPNIQPISYAKRQTKELFPTPTQQIITSLALISSISRCESPCIFMCNSHLH